MKPGEQITAAGLIRALEAGGGILRLTDPADRVRREHRRATHAARISDALPLDKLLQLSGRDRGDLVIRLIPTSDGARRATPARIPIPDEDALEVEGSPELLRTAASLRMSADARPRALRLLRSLSEEATHRGHGVQLGAPGAALAITVGRECFEFDLFEEDDVIDIVPEAEVATKRFSWQRVSPRSTPVPSGRLVLRLHHGNRQASWADRTRWRLEDRLGHSLAHIESIARDAEERRRDARVEAMQRRGLWDKALATAREQFVETFNRRRMEAQLAAWDKARELRTYADSFAAAVSAEADAEHSGRMSDWRSRILAEADQIDPLASRAELRSIVPDDIRPADLEPYMPRGMSVYRPPDVPD